jgi:hypothetical protein
VSEDAFTWKTDYRLKTVWELLEGKVVKITWRDSDHPLSEWRYYRVERADLDWLRLTGADIPGGHSEAFQFGEGGPFVVALKDVWMAEIVG